MTTVEVTAFSTCFTDGLELIESEAFDMLEGAGMLVHLFDNQKLTGVVLRADGAHALVQIGENKWWLERNQRGPVGLWVVRAGEGTTGPSSQATSPR